LRSEMVSKAKSQGVCTQCLKNKATKDRLQCQRCIDTNKRKRERRKHKYDEYQANNYDKTLKNRLRQKVIDFAYENRICTKCFSRKATDTLRQCDICLERKRRWKIAHEVPVKKKRGRPRKPKPTKQEVRARQKQYQRTALVNKVRKLDRIRYAVEKGREL
jgi:hypothetical protein